MGTARKELDTGKLSDLAAQISARRGVSMDGLIARLKADEGLKLVKDQKTGKRKAVMCGVVAKGQHDREALQNWSNKSRRTVLAAG